MNKICKKKKKSAKYLNFFIFYLDNLTVALCVKMSVCVYLSELLCAQLLGLLSVSFPTVAAWKPFNVHMFPSLELMIHVSNNVQITLDLRVFLWNLRATVSRNTSPKGGEQMCGDQQSQPSNFSLNMFFFFCSRSLPSGGFVRLS